MSAHHGAVVFYGSGESVADGEGIDALLLFGGDEALAFSHAIVLALRPEYALQASNDAVEFAKGYGVEEFEESAPIDDELAGLIVRAVGAATRELLRDVAGDDIPLGKLSGKCVEARVGSGTFCEAVDEVAGNLVVCENILLHGYTISIIPRDTSTVL